MGGEQVVAKLAPGDRRGGGPVAAARPRLLVVDDERDLLDIMAQELRDTGFDVTAVDNGRGALEAVRGSCFDVAITDYKMPGMNGVEMMAQLQDIDPSLPIIVVTGYASEGARLAIDARQAYGLLLKPFTLADIRRLIDGAVERERGPRRAPS
jgi:CheY-like chemotaxis protein